LIKKNSYESVDLTKNGGVEYGSDIHGESLRINRLIWDMIDFLNKKGLYGYHIKPTIAKNRIVIVISHKEKKEVKRAITLLKHSLDLENTILIPKIKRVKKKKRLFLIVTAVLFTITTVISSIGYFIYKNYPMLFKSEEIKRDIIDDNSTTIVEIDIKKLKAIQESLKKQNSKLDPKILKSMDITTAVISDAIPPSKKEKYRAENLVKNFKGRGGIKLILVNRDLNSSEFNRSVDELREYANEFTKRGDISNAIKCYSGILKKSKRDDEVVVDTLSKRANLNKQIGEEEKAKRDYDLALKRADRLKEKNSKKYENIEAFILGKKAKLEDNIENLRKAEEEYNRNLNRTLRLYKKNPNIYMQDLAWNYNLVANFYFEDMQDFNKSIKYRKSAIKLYNKLIKKDKSKFKITLYKTYNSLAKTYLKLDEIDLALKYYKIGFDLVKRSRYKEYIAVSLQNLAYIDSLNRKYKNAREKLNKALIIYRESNSTKSLDIEFNLAKIDLITNKLKEAKKAFLKLKREYRLKEIPKYNFNIAKVNINLAIIDIENREIIKAKRLLEENLKLAKKVKKSNIKEYRDILSKTYSHLAHLYTIEKKIDIALAYYEKSLQIVDDLETKIRYANLLYINKKYIDSFRLFEDMLERYKSKRKRARVLKSYGKIYLSFDKKEAKKMLKEALEIEKSLNG